MKDAPAIRPRCMLTAARMRLTHCTCQAVRGIASASAAAKQASRSSKHGSLSTSAVSPTLRTKHDDGWRCLHWIIGLCGLPAQGLTTVLPCTSPLR